MINTTLNLIDDLYNFARSFRSPTLTIKAEHHLSSSHRHTGLYKSFHFFTVPIANLQLVADISPVSIPFMVLIFYAFIYNFMGIICL